MSWTLSGNKLKKFVLNNVNNRLGHDVQEKVMPEVGELGGCEGITNSLGGSLTTGIKSSEVAARKQAYGINYIPPAPPTPFYVFCMDAMGDFTLQMLLFFATIQMVKYPRWAWRPC